MTVIVTKPAVNVREELISLKKPSGIVGESILRADTAADAVEQLNLEDHTFTTFTSTGIDDNATSTKLTVSNSGIDVTGTVTADGLTVDGGANLLTRTSSGSEVRVLELRNNATATSTATSIKFVNSTASGSNSGSTELVGVRTGTNTGDFKIRTSNSSASMANRMLIDSNGNISFYEDIGSTPKFMWDSSEEKLTIDGNGYATNLATSTTASVLELNADSGSGTSAAWFGGISNGSQYVQSANGTGTTSYAFLLNPYGGNVGIGTTSPNLHGWTTAVTLNTSTNAGYELGQSGVKYGAFALQGDGRVQLTNFTANPLTFQTNNTERMRIDGSTGNLLVGKTSADSGTVGIQLENDGRLIATRSAAPVGYFHRNTSNGEVIQVNSLGYIVGSIGTVTESTSRAFYISQSATGLKFYNSGTYIVPCNNTGGDRDNAIDLGTSSTRFKDLYLSGSVYLGGTTSSNALDDYEEGNWTPVLNTDNADMTIASTSFASGRYTKVGRFVQLVVNYSVTFTSVGTGSLKITGFPFNPASDGNYPFYGGPIQPTSGFSTAPTSFGFFGTSNTFRLMNGTTVITASDLSGSTFWIRGTFTYMI